MTYSVDFFDEERYIRVVINGELTLPLFQQIAQEVAKLAKARDCYLIINDLREAFLTSRAFEVVSMPQFAQNNGVMQTFRRALIVGDRKEEFKFLETVFINQGHIVKMFSTWEDGWAWLYE